MPSPFIRRRVNLNKKRRIQQKQKKKAIRKIIPETIDRPQKKIKSKAKSMKIGKEAHEDDMEPMDK